MRNLPQLFGPGWRGIAGDDLTLRPPPRIPITQRHTSCLTAGELVPTPAARNGETLATGFASKHATRELRWCRHEQMGRSNPMAPPGDALARGRQEMDGGREHGLRRSHQGSFDHLPNVHATASPARRPRHYLPALLWGMRIRQGGQSGQVRVDGQWPVHRQREARSLGWAGNGPLPPQPPCSLSCHSSFFRPHSSAGSHLQHASQNGKS